MGKAAEMNKKHLSGWNPPQGYVARSKLKIIKQENRSTHELLSDIVELYEFANFTDVSPKILWNTHIYILNRKITLIQC